VPFLIDTNIAISARDGDEAILTRLSEESGLVFLSALCLVELERGIYCVPAEAGIRRARLDELLHDISVLSFDKAAASAYGRIIAQLGWVRGRDFDRMIAAHAIATSSVLVTANAADFLDIPGLKLENWAQ
jgi:tRNA(fMet)-specific endonuclease VapC